MKKSRRLAGSDVDEAASLAAALPRSIASGSIWPYVFSICSTLVPAMRAISNVGIPAVVAEAITIGLAAMLSEDGKISGRVNQFAFASLIWSTSSAPWISQEIAGVVPPSSTTS